MTKKRGSLSAELSRALSQLASEGTSVFTVEDFAKATGRPKEKTWRVLSFLLDGGWIARLSKGKYLIVPLEAGPESAWSEDSLLIASQLAEPAAVAYWSACHHWNWTEQVPRTVFVQTTQKKMHNTKIVLGVRYRFVRVRPEKFFGVTARSVGSERASVTDREKTLVDSLDRPDLCGGIPQVVEMLPAAGQALDWGKLDSYLKRLGSGAVYKRLGFLVERAGERLPIPNRSERIESWRQCMTGGNALLEPRRPAKGPINSRWRVRVNVSGLTDEERW